MMRRLPSPYTLALLSYAFFLFGSFFPPVVYSHYMNEPDLMFLDPTSMLFFSACVGAFLLGLYVIDFVLPVCSFVDRPVRPIVSEAFFIIVPLAIGIILAVISSVLLLRNNPGLIVLLLSQHGSELKSDIELGGTLALSGVWLMGILWWAMWRFDQSELTGWRRRLVKLIIVAAVLTTLASATLKLGRGELMPIIVGCAIVAFLRRTIGRKANVRFVRRFVLICTISVIAVFVAFSVARGSSGKEAIIRDCFGYTIASYNRLAAVVDGRLRYPFAGRGLYLVSFVGYNNLLNRVVPFRQVFGWPEFYELWQSEFGATWRAGLNGYCIWSGTFGYIFSDIGWYAPLYVFLYGLLYGLVWRSVKLGSTFAVVLYPWFAFNILFWFGTNYLFDTKLVVLATVSIILSCYETVLRPVAKMHVPS